MASASFALILHAHLPFVRHPEHEDFLEEDWLFEAISETYLPLLRTMRRLVDEGVDFRLTLSLTPTLCTMLRDELLQERYLRHLARLIGLATQEIERNRNDSRLAGLSRFYADFFAEAREFFDQILRRDIVRAFRELQDAGFLEIAASAATHGFLPLLRDFPEGAARAGSDWLRQLIGKCLAANRAGSGSPNAVTATVSMFFLQEANLRWFVLDTHGLMFAQPRPRHAIYSPCYTPGRSGRLRA